MKNILYFFFIALTLSSCKKENLFDCLKSTGDKTTERRSITPFTEVEIQDNVNVIFIQDSLTYIEVTAGNNLLPLIITELRDGKLYIENHNTCNWVRDYSVPIDVYVHTSSLRTLHTYGWGRITSQNTIVADTLDVNNHNTSEIELAVSATEIYCRQHACFGDNKLTGSAQYVYIYNAGNGFCDCSGLIANRATVISISTGPSYVNSCDELGTEIKSSGDIYYRGNPAIQSTITGSGKLIQY
ncbi:MAG TPA: DUF2807 domain-containing protein [Bacteroidia bacterium]|nr:DUF2807 domain-containing protein [Bacteroidia bacterium]